MFEMKTYDPYKVNYRSNELESGMLLKQDKFDDMCIVISYDPSNIKTVMLYFSHNGLVKLMSSSGYIAREWKILQ